LHLSEDHQQVQKRPVPFLDGLFSIPHLMEQRISLRLLILNFRIILRVLSTRFVLAELTFFPKP
jgi:hypothetical protein